MDHVDLPENFMLFFGRLDERVKNFSLLLKAFQKCKARQNGLSLLIMGDGPDGVFIDDLISTENLGGSVKRIVLGRIRSLL